MRMSTTASVNRITQLIAGFTVICWSLYFSPAGNTQRHYTAPRVAWNTTVQHGNTELQSEVRLPGVSLQEQPSLRYRPRRLPGRSVGKLGQNSIASEGGVAAADRA